MREPLLITHPEPQDLPVLEQLWLDAFGDPPELVEAFFDRFAPGLTGWIVCRGQEVLSAAYLVHGNALLTDDGVFPAAYLYAVATPEAQRGKGYGGMLMRHLADYGESRGLLLYTRPASAGLFRWYGETMRMQRAEGWAVETLSRTGAQTAHAPRAVDAQTYGALRETLLAHNPHVLLSDAFLSLQEVYLQQEGGGFYAVGEGCCACEVRAGTLVCKELLTPEGARTETVEAMLAFFDAEWALVPVPARDGAPHVAYRSATPHPDVHWGLLLD